MLTMLHQKRYGLEIIDMVSIASEGEIEINVGSLYPALNKLVKHGFIKEADAMHHDENLSERGGHRRKYHMLTEHGRAALKKVYTFRATLRSMQGHWLSCL